MLLEIVLIFGVFLSATQTSEICKSDSGKMTISEETNILAVFKGMAIWIVKFSQEGFKIRLIFCQKATYVLKVELSNNQIIFYIENSCLKSQCFTFC